MNRLRNRLILVFVAATVVPLAVTLWVSHSLLERSLRYSATGELDQISRSLESTARQLYVREREALRGQVTQGKLKADRFAVSEFRLWSQDLQQFWESGEPERFHLAGNGGEVLILLLRRDDEILRYSRSLGGVQLQTIRKQIAQARQTTEEATARDLRRVLILLAVIPWMAALAILIFSTHRITAVATRAYNRMAEQLQQSRERLLFLTRLESWQALARKTAHEVKNSLTPIRLMMEELAARHSSNGGSFERQAAQVIVDEVTGLEKRVRAFSEFASEPPVHIQPLDANALLEERIGFLRAAHPEVHYRLRLQERASGVLADEDLLKAVLTNLLENAAEAAGPHGEVLATTQLEDGRLAIEVHDSGPGLTAQAHAGLFEPTISFKKGGMGLGLSIARKSAVLCGGDIQPIESQLGGAGFRVVLSTT